MAEPIRITSRTLQIIADQLRSSRHPVVTGSIGDLVLLQGEVLCLPEALERMASSSFDVVVRVNAVDGLTVVKGDDALQRVLGGGEGPPGSAVPATDRERRLEQLRQTAGGTDAEDVTTTVRRALGQAEVSVLVLVDQADILLQDPAQHDQPDRDRVAALQLAIREAMRAGRYRNTCVLLAGERRSIPSVLLAGCEDLGLVEVEAPTRAERAAFFTCALDGMHDAALLQTPAAREQIIEELASLTEGEALRDLESLVAFSASSRRSVLEPRGLVHLHRYGDRPNYWAHLVPRLQESRDVLASRVFGQDAAIDAAMGVLSSGALGLDMSGNRFGSEGEPKGLLWFMGSSGVGKTDMAKAIADLVFGDPEAYIRLDMSTFAQEHAAERLMGAPPGYIGYESGGELTNAVRQQPNAVVLLDEIEKAHPRVLDRFMSIFDDGRVTDAQGRVTHFGETIIIATSNVGAREVADLLEHDGDVPYERVRETTLRCLRQQFVDINRLEILGRIRGGVVVFDVLRPEVMDRITMKLIRAATFEHGPMLDIDPVSTCAMVRQALEDPALRALGGRQIRTIVRSRLRELAAWLTQEGHAGAATVSVAFEGHRLLAGVDGAHAVPIG